MPATLKSLPSFYKLTVSKVPTLPASKGNGNTYSSLQRSNSVSKQEKRNFNTSPTTSAASSPTSANKSNYNLSNSRSISLEKLKTLNHHVTTDRQLHDSFVGIIPRVFSLQTLIKKQGRHMMSQLILDDVIATDSLLTGIKLYTDLQNPLLQKYTFSPYTFLSGAKEAFLQIQKAIIMLHLMNNNRFCERNENYQLSEYSTNLLKISLSPDLFRRIEELTNEPIESISDAFNDYILNTNSIKLNSMIIEHVETKIIEGKEERTGERDVSESSSEEKEEEEKFLTKGTSSRIQYPIGSVLSIVDVNFEFEQVYQHFDEREITKPKVKRSVSSNWRFEGCISGHIPLNWMVISMKNDIQSSSLVKNHISN
jgi:hypothetical protein